MPTLLVLPLSILNEPPNNGQRKPFCSLLSIGISIRIRLAGIAARIALGITFLVA